MDLALSLSLFVALFAAWCVLPNAPTTVPREEPTHGKMQAA